MKRLRVHGYGGQPDQYVLLDDQDYELLSRWSWKMSRVDGYPRRTIRTRTGYTTLYMHQVLLGKTDHCNVVDHLNGNRLDYRRANLRRCSQSENLINMHVIHGKCGVPGVYREHSKYRARVVRYKKKITLGLFDTVEEAREAVIQYDKANGYKHDLLSVE